MLMQFAFFLPLLLLLSQTLTFTLAIATPFFNISHFLYPKVHDELRPQPSLFFKDILEAISEKEKWNLDEVRASKLEVKKAKYGTGRRYDFRLRLGKGQLIIKLFDQVSPWNKLKIDGDFESLVKEVSSKAVLDPFLIEGPFELHVAGDDELSLILPMNKSHTGLKRILVGEGITVEVRNAQEVSLFHRSNLHPGPKTSVSISRSVTMFNSSQHSHCMPFFPIHILGSASVVAYRTRNPNSFIETASLSKETIELLPDKCYTKRSYIKRVCPVDSVKSRIALLETLLRSLLGDRVGNGTTSGFLRTKVEASTLFRFQLELERNIKSNDSRWNTLAEWRTRPSVERIWFVVEARVEAGRLKPLLVKRVRPFMEVDSLAWSNLMSNISFTNFPSILVPPESLTLDVKWQNPQRLLAC